MERNIDFTTLFGRYIMNRTQKGSMDVSLLGSEDNKEQKLFEMIDDYIEQA